MSNTNATLSPDTGTRPSPLFRVGDPVRVRTGTSDPDFPGKQLDGWVGVIVERDDAPIPVQYLVHWNEETLARISRDYQDSCELNGFVFDQMWLLEDDLDAAG